jgi:hypothetical protein
LRHALFFAFSQTATTDKSVDGLMRFIVLRADKWFYQAKAVADKDLLKMAQQLACAIIAQNRQRRYEYHF